MVRQAQIGYYACVTHLDHQIGRLLQALIDEGIYDDCIFLFTSDHGDELCDHHFFRKAFPYQGSVHIPMIISGSEKLLKHQSNTVNHAVVELRDVMPTLLDAAGALIPETVEGSSMLPLLRETEKTIRPYLHGEHSFGEKSNHWIVTENEKYIWYSQTGKEQYFNLADDPHELHDLINSENAAPRIECLRNILIRELSDREEGYSDGTRLITGCMPKNCLQYNAKKQ